MNVFDVVAAEPRKGDKVRFAGGLLAYEVISGLNDGLDLSVVAWRITTHRSEPYEKKKSVPINKDVWADLVARAATVERGSPE